MTNEVCYWDEKEGKQKTRDATPAERAEIDDRVKNRKPLAVPKSDLAVLVDVLIEKGVISEADLVRIKENSAQRRS